jgi:hypothetical protein
MSQWGHVDEREAVLPFGEVRETGDHPEIVHDFDELALSVCRRVQPPAFMEDGWLQSVGCSANGRILWS